jgi:hypothetical protein
MTVITKQCTKCLSLKLLTAFPKQRGGRGGLRAMCRVCYSYKLSPEARERTRESKRKWRKRNAERLSLWNKQWRKEHPAEVKEINRRWRLSHPENVKRHSINANTKKLSTPHGRLANSLRCGIGFSLKGNKNGLHWESLAGYTLEQLQKHLGKQFLPGMTWNNYGEWHVDHKIPIAAFNFEKPEDLDFKRCWALSNLQPLWATENMKKGSSTNKPFQPSLLL